MKASKSSKAETTTKKSEESGKIKKLSKDDLKTVKGGFCMNSGQGRCCGGGTNRSSRGGGGSRYS